MRASLRTCLGQFAFIIALFADPSFLFAELPSPSTDEAPTIHSIVNGDLVSDLSKYPFFVSLVIDYGEGVGLDHFCGGTLIEEKKILTAAHCLQGHSKIGSWFTTKELFVRPGNQTSLKAAALYEIEGISAPSAYPLDDGGENDIAIVHLKTAIPGTKPIPFLRSAVLTNGQFPTRGAVVGLGYSDKHETTFPDTLLGIEMPVRTDYECEQSWHQGADGRKYFNPTTHFCAGIDASLESAPDRPDVCGGDSGGPFLVEVEGRQYVAGVVSKGDHICGRGRLSQFTHTMRFEEFLEGEPPLIPAPYSLPQMKWVKEERLGSTTFYSFSAPVGSYVSCAAPKHDGAALSKVQLIRQYPSGLFFLDEVIATSSYKVTARLAPKGKDEKFYCEVSFTGASRPVTVKSRFIYVLAADKVRPQVKISQTKCVNNVCSIRTASTDNFGISKIELSLQFKGHKICEGSAARTCKVAKRVRQSVEPESLELVKKYSHLSKISIPRGFKGRINVSVTSLDTSRNRSTAKKRMVAFKR